MLVPSWSAHSDNCLDIRVEEAIRPGLLSHIPVGVKQKELHRRALPLELRDAHHERRDHYIENQQIFYDRLMRFTCRLTSRCGELNESLDSCLPMQAGASRAYVREAGGDFAFEA